VPVASAITFSCVSAFDVRAPTSPAMRPSRITSARSQMPMISGRSDEMTRMATPDFARLSMIE